MAIFLFIVIGLIIWALRLLQGAIKLRDSSLILASTLVGVSAVGVVAVYLLMDGCMSFFSTPHLAFTQIDSAQLDMSIPPILYDSEPEISMASHQYDVLQLVKQD